LATKSYFVVTAHRSENVDNPSSLQLIITALGKIAERYGREVVYPMHPRTRSKMSAITVPSNIRIIDPLGFYDFNRLLQGSYCILSDSGTAPEEAYFYRVPCVSLRMTTERPETVEGGANIVAGLDPENIVEAAATAVEQEWSGRYDLEENFSASSVVVNCLRSRITNFF
jgi:UDP-N-acetylglucosamine 2-epimerase (non-hydrolysing)